MKNKNEIKKLITILLAALMVFSCTGCETWNNFKAAFIDEKEEVHTIKIGVLEPITGTDATSAADEIKGIELAHSVYSSIGVNPVELVYSDNGSDVELCPTAAQTLIDAGCSIILGSYKSVLTLASSDVIYAGHLPAIAITNTNPLITETNPYYFRVCMVDAFEGEVAAKFVYNQLQTTKVAILMSENDDYASAMATEFISVSEEISGEFEYISTYTFSEDTKDFEELLLNLSNASPDAIFFPEEKSLAKDVMTAAQEGGYEFTWIGTSKWDGIEFENAYYTLDYDPSEATTEMSQTFRSEYGKAYGWNKEPSEATALGFDAYLLAIHAIEETMYDDELSVVQALEQTENLEGATGYITMSKSGDPKKEVIVEKYEYGSRSAVYVMLPDVESRGE